MKYFLLQLTIILVSYFILLALSPAATLAACNVTVQVLFADGSPAPDAVVEVRQNSPPYGVATEGKTGPDGLASVDVGQAGAYRFRGLYGVLPEGRVTTSVACNGGVSVTLGAGPKPGSPTSAPAITPIQPGQGTQVSTPERTPQPIDTGFGSGPSWGEDVKIERKVSKECIFDRFTGGCDWEWEIEPLSDIQVGPKDKLEFPNLAPYLDITKKALVKLVPENLRRELFIPNDQLEGIIFHPVCDVTSPLGKPPGVETESKGSAIFQTDPIPTPPLITPPFWTVLLGATKIVQSIAVPGFSSWVNLIAFQPPLPGEEQNKQLPNCPQPKGPTNTYSISVPSKGLTTITGKNWNDAIIAFFDPLWPAGGSTTVTVHVKPKKFLPGEETLKNQTSHRKTGFLRSFCPQVLCPPDSNEQIAGVYTAAGKIGEIKHEFKGVCGARRGYSILEESLFPESFKNFAFREIAQKCIVEMFIQSAPFDYPESSKLTTINFIIPLTDTTIAVSDETKQRIMAQVKQRYPNSPIDQLWDEVVAQSIKEGVNPALSLAVWIEESGAGGHPKTQSDFGCFPGGDTSQTVPFDRSLSCFNYFTSVEHPDNFTDWIRYFCGPKAEPVCSNNANFPGNLKHWYDKLTK